MSNLELKNICKNFSDSEIIKDVSFSIEKGEFIVFVGPSGCGKSTLLRLISGLEDISDGELLMDGETINELPPVKRDVAMVFQSYALYPHMNTYDNMAFGLRNLKIDEAEIKERVETAAEILQIQHLMESKPKDMSGGQRQRVAIGRTIVRKPKMFLFDEPLSNLDAALRVQMRIEMARLHKRLATTMIYVTHDQVEAMTLADRIVVLRDGRVEQIGRPLELYENPCNTFVAGFIGSPSMNFIDCRVLQAKGRELKLEVLSSGDNISLTMQRDAREPVGGGEKITLGIRPESVSLHEEYDDPIEIKGSMIAVEELGNTSYGYVEIGDQSVITCRAENFKGRKESQTIHFLGADCYIFNQAGSNLFK